MLGLVGGASGGETPRVAEASDLSFALVPYCTLAEQLHKKQVKARLYTRALRILLPPRSARSAPNGQRCDHSPRSPVTLPNKAHDQSHTREAALPSERL